MRPTWRWGANLCRPPTAKRGRLPGRPGAGAGSERALHAEDTPQPGVAGPRQAGGDLGEDARLRGGGGREREYERGDGRVAGGAAGRCIWCPPSSRRGPGPSGSLSDRETYTDAGRCAAPCPMRAAARRRRRRRRPTPPKRTDFTAPPNRRDDLRHPRPTRRSNGRPAWYAGPGRRPSRRAEPRGWVRATESGRDDDRAPETATTAAGASATGPCTGPPRRRPRRRPAAIGRHTGEEPDGLH